MAAVGVCCARSRSFPAKLSVDVSPAAATAITNKFLAKAGLIYKAAIPALAHQQMAGTITPEGAEQLNGLMAMMPDANAAGMGLDQFCPYYIDKLSAFLYSLMTLIPLLLMIPQNMQLFPPFPALKKVRIPVF